MENFRRNRDTHALGDLSADEFLAKDPKTISYEDAHSFFFTVDSGHPRFNEVRNRVTQINDQEVQADFFGATALFALK